MFLPDHHITQACPRPAPVLYHHVLNQKNVAQVSAGNGNQRKEKSQKRHHVAQEKSAANIPKQDDMWAHAANVKPVQSTVHQLYGPCTCVPGFREPSSVSDVKSIHWSSFPMYLPTVSKIQSALKCAFDLAFAKQWLTGLIVGQPVPVPTRAVLYEGRKQKKIQI